MQPGGYAAEQWGRTLARWGFLPPISVKEGGPESPDVNELPIGYAYTAGMLATVNPCGFALLPTYVAYYLGMEGQEQSDTSLLWRGLMGVMMGLVVTLGFLTVFSSVGLVISLGGSGLALVFPKAALLVGVGLIALGLWLLITGKSLGLTVASRVAAPYSKGVRGAYLYGLAYAVASLSCTLPIFLVVVGGALASGTALAGLIQFVSYGLGMGTVMMAVTLSTALFRGAVARQLRIVLPYVGRISAIFIIGAGSYLVYYWVRYGVLLGL